MKNIWGNMQLKNNILKAKSFIKYNTLRMVNTKKYFTSNKLIKVLSLIILSIILFSSLFLVSIFIFNNMFNNNIYLKNHSKYSIGKNFENNSSIKSVNHKSKIFTGKGGAYLPEIISTPVTFFTYTIQSGDSIHSIAKKLRIDEITIIKSNNIKIPSRIWVGMKLQIPNQDGLVVKVTRKNSIDKIAKKYGFDKDELLRVNNITDVNNLKTIFVPGIEFDSITKSLILGEYFQRPAYGRFSSGFGWRRDPFTHKRSFHTGVDIANRKGSYVYAAGPGKVIYTGKRWPFGNMIKIQHTSGYVTIYGHLSRILVRRYSWVSMGTVIGLIGSTGRSTGPHLHYEVRRYKKLVNPFSVTIF